MATKWRKRIAKAVSHAMMERDRVEMRAMDALLSVIEQPRRRRTRTGRRPSTAQRRQQD
jgi:hypothetical protein